MCPVVPIYNKKFKFYDVEESAQRIKRYYDMGVRFITFTDDNLAVHTKKFNKLMDRLKEFNFKGMQYICQEGFETIPFGNEEFVRNLKEMKFVDIKLGFENINERFLKEIDKYYDNFEVIEIAIENIKKYNLKVGFLFLIGLSLTREEIFENLRFLAKHRLDVRTNVLRPYSGRYTGEELGESVLPYKELKKLASLSYTSAFFATQFDIDIFEDAWCDVLAKLGLKENCYLSGDDFDGQLCGKCNYGFKTSRLIAGLKYIMQRDYPNHKIIITSNDKTRIRYLIQKINTLEDYFG